MTKQGEIDYLKNIGKCGVMHSINKPFSDDACGALMAEMGAIMSLLPNPPAKVLDMGCGTGWTSIFFAKRGYDVVGVDISSESIKHAAAKKTQEKLKNLRFVQWDYEKNINSYSNFDCVVFIDSLHHAVNEEKALRTAYNSLKPNGICIVSEPGAGHSKTINAVNAVKRFGVTEKDMPPKKIVKVAKKAGFREFRVYPRAEYINFALYDKPNKIPRLNFLIRRLFKFSFIRTLAAVLVIVFYKRYDGIVQMRK